MYMFKQLLVTSIVTCFLIDVKTHRFNFLSLRQQLQNLVKANAKYQEAMLKYNDIAKNDFNDVIIVIPITNYLKQELKKIARTDIVNEEKIKLYKEKKVKAEHETRMKDIIEFMKDHMITTKYLYDEVQRIKRTREVKGPLREMVEYLERPDKSEERHLLYSFFKTLVKRAQKVSSVWDQKMHDTVINTIKDPFNDGVIN